MHYTGVLIVTTVSFKTISYNLKPAKVHSKLHKFRVSRAVLLVHVHYRVQPAREYKVANVFILCRGRKSAVATNSP